MIDKQRDYSYDYERRKCVVCGSPWACGPDPYCRACEKVGAIQPILWGEWGANERYDRDG